MSRLCSLLILIKQFSGGSGGPEIRTIVRISLHLVNLKLDYIKLV